MRTWPEAGSGDKGESGAPDAAACAGGVGTVRDRVNPRQANVVADPSGQWEGQGGHAEFQRVLHSTACGIRLSLEFPQNALGPRLMRCTRHAFPRFGCVCRLPGICAR